MSVVKAAVSDWAGTTIDFGSFAPMGFFVAAFEKFGIIATIEEAHGPMGSPKRDHIRGIPRRTSSAPTISPKAAPGRWACTSASSISSSTRRKPSSRSTTRRPASPRALPPAASPSASRCQAITSARPSMNSRCWARRNDALRQSATNTMKEAGAVHAIDTVADLPPLIDVLDAKP